LRTRSSGGTRTAAGVCLAVALAGCGEADPRTEIRFWAFGREGEAVAALVPEFERRNPDLRVRVEQVPWTAAHEKLITAYVGKATPDLAQLGNTWISEFASLGAIEPLDQALAGSRAISRADFFPGVWDANVVGDTTWGVPWYVDTRLLFYRRDLVEQSGAPWPPRSWAEWRTAMERVKGLVGKDRYAILLPIEEWDKPVILGLQTGSPLLRDGDRHGNFRDPRFRRALDFYVDLFRSDLAPPLTEHGISNLFQQFEEGFFAMVVTGPWNLGEFRRRLPPEFASRWATAPLPPPDAGDAYPGASLAGGSSLVVFRRSPRRDAAFRFVEFLAEPAQQARFYELSGNLPARVSAWSDGRLAGDVQASAFRAQLERAVPMPKVPECEQIAQRVAQTAEEVMRGARGIDQALADLDADVDRMLAKRRRLLDKQAAAGARQ
jgi:multiple sugar transport system substrate-binding protein